MIIGLICLAIGIVGLILLAAAFLSPLLTFLVLFTTLGNVLHRALRGKPLRTAYRFDLRALVVLITFTALSIGWLKASYFRRPSWSYYEFETPDALPATRDIWGNHDPLVYAANWLIIAIPISMLLVLTRYLIDLYDDRSRPILSVTQAPPNFAGITLPEKVAEMPPAGRDLVDE